MQPTERETTQPTQKGSMQPTQQKGKLNCKLHAQNVQAYPGFLDLGGSLVALLVAVVCRTLGSVIVFSCSDVRMFFSSGVVRGSCSRCCSVGLAAFAYSDAFRCGVFLLLRHCRG